jgi:thiamine kinase-like enzyme
MPAGITGPGFVFWVFHVNRDYLAQLRQRRRLDEGEIAEWLELNAALEAAQVPLPIVYGHHDLLAANLIDDGSRLWLIDYEYAGFGTAMFDLANLSSNNGLAPDQAQALLAAYFGTPPEPALLRSHAAMECASLLREALWALVSDDRLDAPGVDYPAYAAEYFARLDAALDRYRTRFGAARHRRPRSVRMQRGNTQAQCMRSARFLRTGP